MSEFVCGHKDFNLLDYLHGSVPMILLEEYERYLNTKDRKLCFCCHMKNWIRHQKELKQELKQESA